MVINEHFGKRQGSKLRAAAPRAAGRYSEDEYLIEEPNVKFVPGVCSRASLTRGGGLAAIFAFSALKDRQQANGFTESRWN